MSSEALVSVVTPVLNGARFLPECLASVRAQTQAVQHIVIDGGSQDGTLELLAAAPGIEWESARDRGMYDAINRGFRRARGEFLTYQNADDRYASPEALARLVERFQAEPGLDVAHGGFRFVDAAGQPDRRRPPRPAPANVLGLARSSVVPPHATLVRAELVRTEGFWLDPELRYAGDWEWFLRLWRAGKRFGRVDAMITDFRTHAEAQTARVSLTHKLAEWRTICHRHRLSFLRVCWHELVYGPWQYRRSAARERRDTLPGS